MELDARRILLDLGFAPSPDRMTPISGGWDTSIWRIDVQAESYALRVFRVEQARTCQREAAIMRALNEQGLPVPAVHAEGVGQGRPALLLEWCPGRPLLAEINARPWRIWRLGTQMGRMHARIHAARLPDAVRMDLPRVEVQSLEGQRDTLLHLDYHPLNVLTGGKRISGVLDWSNAAMGDPRADLARTVTILRLAPMPRGLPLPVELLLRQLLEAAWRSGYRDQPRRADGYRELANPLANPVRNPFVEMDPFYVWAGEWMERDLRPKLGRPGVWLRETDLLRIHQWTTARKKRVAALSRV